MTKRHTPVVETTATVCDIAAAIIGKNSRFPRLRLEAMLFYAQALHLTKHKVPLFPERIYAFGNGPRINEISQRIKGSWVTPAEIGTTATLDVASAKTVARIQRMIGPCDGHALQARITHENPWKDAYRTHAGCVISTGSMYDYYTPERLDTLALLHDTPMRDY